MTTTPHASSVARESGLRVMQLAELVREMVLQPRRVFLKHRSPRSAYVKQLRRDIACGKAKPVEMMMAITFSDIDDGAPVAAVISPLETMIALAREHAATRDRRRASAGLPPLFPLIRAENRSQAKCDETEREVIANPECVLAIDRALEARAEYDTHGKNLVEALRSTRARLTSTAEPISAIS